MLSLNHFRLGFTNIYSIDENKAQSLFLYHKYSVLYELIHSPILGFTEEQIVLLPLSIFYIFLDCLAHISASVHQVCKIRTNILGVT